MSASEDHRDATADASDQGEGGSKSHTRKDRPCPFCKQTFTSSSLGRHLDLYIKEKNPKAADGVHDVAQIKELRRGITRRHARSGTHAASLNTISSVDKPAKRTASLSSTPLQQSPAAAGATATPPIPGLPPSHPIAATSAGETNFAHHAQSPMMRNHSERHPVTQHLNRLNWQATGVINDLPPRSSSTLSRELPRPAAVRGDNDNNRFRDAEEREVGQATEYALKEVLEKISSAQAKLRTDPLFDFEFLEMNFPALCLRLLPPSPMLFSTTQVGTKGSCPLGPPGQDAFDSVVHVVYERLLQASNVSVSPVDHPYLLHVRDSCQTFDMMPPSEQLSVWHMELQRLYNSVKTDLQSANRGVEHLQRENEQLRLQIDRLREAPSMQPWQKPLFPPPPQSLALSRLSPAVLQELIKNTEEQSWDYDALIEKWKRYVKTMTRPLSTVASGVRDGSQQPWSGAHPPPQSHTAPIANVRGDGGNHYGAGPTMSAFGHPGTPPLTIGSTLLSTIPQSSAAARESRMNGMRIAELVHTPATTPNGRGTKRARLDSGEREEEDGSEEDNNDSSDDDGGGGEAEEYVEDASDQRGLRPKLVP